MSGAETTAGAALAASRSRRDELTGGAGGGGKGTIAAAKTLRSGRMTLSIEGNHRDHERAYSRPPPVTAIDPAPAARGTEDLPVMGPLRPEEDAGRHGE